MARIDYNDAVAEAFHASRELPPGALSEWRAAIARHLAPRPGMRVLGSAEGFPDLAPVRIGLLRNPHESSALADAPGPAVAVSDWIKAVPDQIARWVPGTFTSLGTDGFGFSDTRPAARRFFHVDAESITVAVLWELARTGAVDAGLPAQAIARYRLDLPVSEALS